MWTQLCERHDGRGLDKRMTDDSFKKKCVQAITPYTALTLSQTIIYARLFVKRVEFLSHQLSDKNLVSMKTDFFAVVEKQ